jgi:hypothetical protein
MYIICHATKAANVIDAYQTKHESVNNDMV